MKKISVTTFSRKQIFEIANAYSKGNYTYLDFLNEHPDFSQCQFYHILHLAVDKAIVTEQIAQKMKQVAVASSMQKAEETYSDFHAVEAVRIRVSRSWERRINCLKCFCFSKKDAIKIVEQYSQSPLSSKEFCKEYCIEPKLFYDTFIETIILNWISDECFDRLYTKAMKSQNTEQVDHLFYQLTKRRNETKILEQKQ